MNNHTLPETAVLFFCFSQNRATSLESHEMAPYSFTFWSPLGTSFLPSGLPLYPFGVWTLFHHFKLFANPGYSVLLAFFGRELVHRSVVTPRYFRFPFMAKGDLQIGDVWTAARHRGMGIATYALRRIVERDMRPDRRIWYVVEEENLASIKIAERTGFKRYGSGVRTTRFGINLLGSFRILRRYETERF